MRTALAIDVGSSGGKAVLGIADRNGFSWREVYRFDHEVLVVEDTLRWDLPALESHVKEALCQGRAFLAQNFSGAVLDSVAVDTWGVDYVWVDEDCVAVAPAYAYRDGRGGRVFPQFCAEFSARSLWDATGNQAEPITTCVQLYAERGSDGILRPPERAARFLFLPDYLSTVLGAAPVAGAGIASTSGLATPKTDSWSVSVREILGLEAKYYPQLVDELAVVGATEGTAIVRGGSHDTACAVHALGLGAQAGAFISCGSWSLVGFVTPSPQLGEAVFAAGFTNETCLDGQNRLLANMTGTWLLQQCRRAWNSAGNNFTFAQLAQLGAQAVSLGVVIDPDDEAFEAAAQPGGPDLPELIVDRCAQLHGVKPGGVGQIVRLIIESLAQAHARKIAALSELTGFVPSEIYMVGGGIQDELLCQLTANSCALPVIAGPVEASAIGSVLAQLQRLGVDISGALAGEQRRYEPAK